MVERRRGERRTLPNTAAMVVHGTLGTKFFAAISSLSLAWVMSVATLACGCGGFSGLVFGCGLAVWRQGVYGQRRFRISADRLRFGRSLSEHR